MPSIESRSSVSGCSSVGSGDDGEMSYTPHSSTVSDGNAVDDAVCDGDTTVADDVPVDVGVECGEYVEVAVASGVRVLVGVAVDDFVADDAVALAVATGDFVFVAVCVPVAVEVCVAVDVGVLGGWRGEGAAKSCAMRRAREALAAARRWQGAARSTLAVHRMVAPSDYAAVCKSHVARLLAPVVAPRLPVGELRHDRVERPRRRLRELRATRASNEPVRPPVRAK